MSMSGETENLEAFRLATLENARREREGIGIARFDVLPAG